MAKADPSGLLATFRSRLRRYVASRAAACQGFKAIHRYAVDTRHAAYLFGSTLRGLLVPTSGHLHDLDVVVASTSADLASAFQNLVKRRTRFGGLHLKIGDLPIDIWPLGETWAFRERLVAGGDFESLPKTTFLNVEAVTAELVPARGKARRVYSHGFFESIAARCLDINFEDNPSPAMCVARSLVVASRLGFAIGPRLAKYISHHGQKIPVEEVLGAARGHYRHLFLQASDFHGWLLAVNDQLRISSRRPVSLPCSTLRQSSFFWASPAFEPEAERPIPLGFSEQFAHEPPASYDRTSSATRR